MLAVYPGVPRAGSATQHRGCTDMYGLPPVFLYSEYYFVPIPTFSRKFRLTSSTTSSLLPGFSLDISVPMAAVEVRSSKHPRMCVYTGGTYSVPGGPLLLSVLHFFRCSVENGRNGTIYAAFLPGDLLDPRRVECSDAILSPLMKHLL